MNRPRPGRCAALVAWAAIGFLWTGTPGSATADAVAVGAAAPPFELVGSDGEIHSLSRYLGKQAVVLAWFPKAFTPG